MKKKRFLLIFSSILLIAIAGFFTVQMVQADPLNEKLKEAKHAYDNKEFERSAKLYGEALELESGHVEARIGKANSFIALSQPEDAIDTLKEGIRLNAKEPRFYYFLSTAYIAAKDANNAILTLQDGVEATGNKSLEELYEQMISNTYIDVERSFVQVNHSRELALVWENNGTKLPIEAEWETDSDLGEITKSDEATVEFTAIETGEVKVTAKVESFEKEIELKVEGQVIEEIHFEPAELGPLNIGETAYVSVTGLDMNGEEMNFTPEWESSKDIIEFSTTKGQSTSLTAIDEGLTMVLVEYQELVEEYKVIVAGENKLLSTAVDGEGNIFINPDEASYAEDSQVVIEAVPESGWEFVRWEGDVSGNEARITVTMNDHKNVRAVFSLTSHEPEIPTIDVEPVEPVPEPPFNEETQPKRDIIKNENSVSEKEKINDKKQPTQEEKEKVDSIPETETEPKTTIKIEKKTEKITYQTIIQHDPTLEKGKENIAQQGVDGIRTITYEITLTDGKETNRKVVGNTITKKPINKIVRVGTKERVPEDDVKDPENDQNQAPDDDTIPDPGPKG